MSLGSILTAWNEAWAGWGVGAATGFFALLGLVVGSFLNVVIVRWPRMMERQWWQESSAQLQDAESFARTFGSPAPEALSYAHQALDTHLQDLKPYNLALPRSHCPACGHILPWWHNLPLISWVALRGRCAACRSPIGWTYPLVEMACAMLFAGMAWRLGASPHTLLWCGWGATLLAAAVIDWRTTMLPDALTLPLVWTGLVATALGWTLPEATLPSALAGACAGYLSLWAVRGVFLALTGREGMGRGDFKLLAAVGAWLGWQALLPVVLWASLSGTIVGLAMKRWGTLRQGLYVPFGPFLAASALAVWWIGPSTSLHMVFQLVGVLRVGSFP